MIFIYLSKMSLDLQDIEYDILQTEYSHNCLTSTFNCLSLNTGRLISCLSLPLFCCAPIVVIGQGHQGVLTRFGVFREILKPGRYAYNMCVDDIFIISMKTQNSHIDTLKVMTKDNLSTTIDAVCFFNVKDAYKSVFNVENIVEAIKDLSKCTLRTIVGENSLDELFSNRSTINGRITELIRSRAEEWGIGNIVLEIKDVSIPPELQRIMAKTAESKKEAESKLIVAEGEKKANQVMLQAAESLKNNPEAMELIWFNTLKNISTEKSTTIVVPTSIIQKFQQLSTQ
jgi:regulator of protease activity HflC (stomatin/prohibitin superfamily)